MAFKVPVIDPSQYTPEGLFVIDTPEKELLLAVLKRAIEDASLLGPTQKNIRREASSWLKNTHSHKVNSINWVLDNISTNSEVALRAIRKMLNDKQGVQLIKERFHGHRVNYPRRRTSSG